jgi:hypothetical protein
LKPYVLNKIIFIRRLAMKLLTHWIRSRTFLSLLTVGALGLWAVDVLAVPPVGGAAAPIRSVGTLIPSDGSSTLNTLVVQAGHPKGLHFVFGMGQGKLSANSGFTCQITRSDGESPLGKSNGALERKHERTAAEHDDIYSISLLGTWPSTRAEVTYTFECEVDMGSAEITEHNLNVIVVPRDFTVPND